MIPFTQAECKEFYSPMIQAWQHPLPEWVLFADLVAEDSDLRNVPILSAQNGGMEFVHAASFRRRGYIVNATRLAVEPPSRPCHSANSNASLICSSGYLCDITFATGILSCTRTKNCKAASMIQGS